jgi:hypothetical protein
MGALDGLGELHLVADQHDVPRAQPMATMLAS